MLQISGTSAPELTVWRLSFVSLDGTEGLTYDDVKKARGGGSPPRAEDGGMSDGGGDADHMKSSDQEDETVENDSGSPLRCTRLGTILRQGKGP